MNRRSFFARLTAAATVAAVAKALPATATPASARATGNAPECICHLPEYSTFATHPAIRADDSFVEHLHTHTFIVQHHPMCPLYRPRQYGS